MLLYVKEGNSCKKVAVQNMIEIFGYAKKQLTPKDQQKLLTMQLAMAVSSALSLTINLKSVSVCLVIRRISVSSLVNIGKSLVAFFNLENPCSTSELHFPVLCHAAGYKLHSPSSSSFDIEIMLHLARSTGETTSELQASITKRCEMECFSLGPVFCVTRLSYMDAKT